MQRYRFMLDRSDGLWKLWPYGETTEYTFRTWRDGMDMLYPRAPRTDVSRWSKKLREFYGV